MKPLPKTQKMIGGVVLAAVFVTGLPLGGTVGENIYPIVHAQEGPDVIDTSAPLGPPASTGSGATPGSFRAAQDIGAGSGSPAPIGGNTTGVIDEAGAGVPDPSAASNENRDSPGSAKCLFGKDLVNFSACLKDAAAWLAQTMMSAVGVFVWMAGVVLNKAVEYTVIEMGRNVNLNSGVILEGWSMFRDLANIVLIFTLLFIGIATILRVSGYQMRELLAKLIIVALLVNFSLFFTQAIIDVSNLLGTQFYNQINSPSSNIPGNGISDGYQNAFRLTTLFKLSGNNTLLDLQPQTYFADNLSAGKIIIIGIVGSVFLGIAAFVLFAAAILLAIRYAVLVLLMILAPLAFVGLILPKASGYAKDWWNKLFSYSLFAPIYLLLTWFVLTLANSDSFRSSIGLTSTAGGPAFSDITRGQEVETASIVVNFLIVVALTVATLVIARVTGIQGAATISSWGTNMGKRGLRAAGYGAGGATVGLAGAAFRNTIGRAASKTAGSEWFKERASRSRIGEWTLRTAQKTARASGDVRTTALGKKLGLGAASGKGGYEKVLEDQVKKRTEFAEKTLGRATLKQAEREQVQHARQNLTVAQNALEPANKRLRRAEAAHAARSTTQTQQALTAAQNIADLAQQRVRTEEEALRNMQTAIETRGRARQEQYATTLEARRIFGIGLKVPRKNKVAADEIRRRTGRTREQRLADDLQDLLRERSQQSEGQGGRGQQP